ncbi:YlxR family protein [Aurantimicrobium minutum]|uniref:YlxR family protein n=1 Tax=Aurantimicrobium minutum TaxID=708131 RepID=UPI0024752A76|nr:YlxR family protein [Aurantimicrobium minutum]MDH6423868.1 putative RNA-binding protein YlxR (DUF448 family) [Aurantimicrobium minutum]
MEPVRTCIGCRQRSDKSALLRVIEVDGRVEPDISGSAPGRGAWLHPTPECCNEAVKRRAFGRALRAEITNTDTITQRLNG